MTEYRPVLWYRTSGNAEIKITGEWGPHQDHAKEVVDEAMRSENFIDSKVEMKHEV